VVVQLVRIPACHAGGRGFESRPYRKKSFIIEALFFCPAPANSRFGIKSKSCGSFEINALFYIIDTEMAIKHALITRFNLKIWLKDKSDIDTLSPEWLEERFGLFEQFCFPSVFNQSDKNFVWYCFFDINTPQEYKKKIDNYRSKFVQFAPIYLSEIDGADGYNAIIKQTVISDFRDSGCNMLITTRLDNDDSIQCDFVREVNAFAKLTSKEDLYLVYKYGYQYFCAQNLITKIKYPSNHFFSRIETNTKEIQTVLAIKHSHIRKKSIASKTAVVFINNKNNPFWIEVIHDRNVANDLYIAFRIRDIANFFLTRPVLKNRTLSEFGIDVSITKKNELHQFFLFFIPKVFRVVFDKLRR
jgi:hypothetical protein